MVENPVEFNEVWLDSPGKTYQVQWFNTREGGELAQGTVDEVVASGAPASLGLPPEQIGSDWLAVLLVTN